MAKDWVTMSMSETAPGYLATQAFCLSRKANRKPKKIASAAFSTKQIGSSRMLLNSRPTACQGSELTYFVQRSNDAPCWRSIQVPARR